MDEPDEMPELDWNEVTNATRQFAVIAGQERLLSQRKKELRDRLFALVQIVGEEDDRGHLRLELPDSVEGVNALLVQRRVTRALDAEKAEEILRSIVNPATGETLWDDCIEMVPVLDEDKVMAARYEELLTDEQIDAMYPVTVTEAFTVQK